MGTAMPPRPAAGGAAPPARGPGAWLPASGAPYTGVGTAPPLPAAGCGPGRGPGSGAGAPPAPAELPATPTGSGSPGFVSAQPSTLVPLIAAANAKRCARLAPLGTVTCVSSGAGASSRRQKGQIVSVANTWRAQPSQLLRRVIG